MLFSDYTMDQNDATKISIRNIQKLRDFGVDEKKEIK